MPSNYGSQDRQDERARQDFRGGRSGAHGEPQTELKHPEEWAGDLNPDHMAGQNIGQPAAEGEQNARNARDHKDLHRTLADRFTDDELQSIPVLEGGTRLRQGGTYIDLNDPGREEFTATGEMESPEQGAIVPKDRVPYSIWNRLRGFDDPERAPQQRADRDR